MSMTVLLDSSAWLEYFFGSEKGGKVKPFLEGAQEFVVCTKINIFEVYQKIFRERGKEEAERYLSFVLLKSFLDELSTETLKLAAEEKIKKGLGMADAIILATAIKYDAVLYTSDRDFERVKDVAKIVFL